MSNPHQPVEELKTSFHTLHQRWEETKSLWNDAVRRHFERTYWEPLEHQAQATYQEAARLAEALTKAMHHAP